MSGSILKDTEKLRALIEQEHTAHLWGQPYRITPRLVDEVFGRGDRLIWLSPVMHRPNHYFVRIDRRWDLHDDFPDHLYDIIDSIGDQFPCDCEECCCGRCEEYDESLDLGWPYRCLSDGCSWGVQQIPELKRERKRQAMEDAAKEPANA